MPSRHPPRNLAPSRPTGLTGIGARSSDDSLLPICWVGGSSRGTGAAPRDIFTVCAACCGWAPSYWGDAAVVQDHLRGTLGGYQYLPTNFVQCLANITNGCTGVLDCYGLTPKGSADTCGTCIGNAAVICHADGSYLWDCTKAGGTCQAGDCQVPGHPPCDLATFQEGCDPTGRPVHCDDHVYTGPTCADFGLQCTSNLGATGCDGTGASCVTETSYFDIPYTGVSCNGNVLDACVLSKRALLDCSCFGQGFSCQTAQGASFCGAASECDPKSYPKSCDGDSVVFCNAGKLVHVACADLGFTKGCASSAKMGCTP
ncbi:MAG: hypothetical protein R3B13_40705 [Polyangiaceae bacterium]